MSEKINGASSGEGEELAGTERIRVASWNVAGVNNNPFEYWVSTEDPDYIKLMVGVQSFMILSQNDVMVREIFTPAMFSSLELEMRQAGVEHIDRVGSIWENDYSRRRILSQFLLDEGIGMKRLSSMPDRVTNFLCVSDGRILHRPSVISGFSESWESVENWWKQWLDFMFHNKVIPQCSASPEPRLVYSLLSPIPRSKYPAIEEQEQAASVGLQLLCLAILDAAFLHVVQAVSPDGGYREVHARLRRALVDEKVGRTCRIIAESYSDMDVLFLQEASPATVALLRDHPLTSDKYFVVGGVARGGGGAANQDSVVLADRSAFEESSARDVTGEVQELLDGPFLAPGDLVAAELRGIDGRDWLLASFHGDGNGLSTQPTIRAVARLARTRFPRHVLLMGVDANTFSGAPGRLHHAVDSFLPFLSDLGLVTSWGARPDPALRTTCSSRTFLQAQLTKATRAEDRSDACHQNLKDWILGFAHQGISFCEATRDNTGRRTYLDDLPLPTTDFPSDHAVVSCLLLLPSDALRQCPSSVHPGSEMLEPSAFIHPIPTTGWADPVLPAASPHSSSHPGPRPPRRDSTGTLFEYWGISAGAACDGTTAEATPQARAAWQRPGRLAPDRTPEEEVRDMCESFFVEHVRQPRDRALDLRKRAMAVRGEDTAWILFSTRPVSLALKRPLFQAFHALVGVALILEAVMHIFTVAGMSDAEGSAFRLGPGAGAAADLVLLKDGCALRDVPAVADEGGVRGMRFPGTVVFNGWCVETPLGGSLSPVDALGVLSSTDGQSWDPLPLPPWTRALGAAAVTRAEAGNRTHYTVDLRPPFEWVEVYCCARFLLGVSVVASVVVARAGYARNAILVSSAAFTFVGWWLGVYAAEARVTRHAAGDVWVNAWYAALFFSFGFTLYQERFQVDLLFFQGCAAMSGRVLNFALQDETPSLIRGAQMMFVGCDSALIVYAVVLLAARTAKLRSIRNVLVREDRARYDAIWSQVMSSEAEAASASILSRLAAQLSPAAGATPIQRNHVASEALLTRPWLRRMLSPTSELPEVTSLDQLAHQASCLDCFLRRKVLALARCSGGYLPVGDGAGAGEARLEKWSVAGEAPGASSRVVWAPLKGDERALEKLFRCYDGRVARLLDCCRQRIVFDSIGDVAACLEAMAQDGEINIVRIKNSLDPRRGAWERAGYRHVLVNLQIRSEGTCRLGLDHHVCELQLGLMRMEEAMSPEMHARFLLLRTCRTVHSVFCYVRQLSESSPISSPKLLHSIRVVPLAFSPHQHISNRDIVCKPGPPPLLRKESIASTSPMVADSPQAPTRTMSVNCSAREQALQATFEAHLRAYLSSSATSRHDAASRDRLIEQAVAGTAYGSTWDMSHPFAAALCKPWLPALAAAAAVVLTVNLALIIQLVFKRDFVEGRRFRFTSLEARVAGREDGPGVSEFRLWMEGACHLEEAAVPLAAAVENNSLVLSFGEVRRVNRWCFETGDGSADADPVRFVVERSLEASGESWEVVGGSSATWAWNGLVVWGHARFDTPLVREWAVYFDLRRPLIWKVLAIAVSLWYLLVILVLLAMTLTRRHMKGRMVTASGLLGGVVMHVVQGVGCLAQAQPHMGVTALAFSAVQLGLALILLLKENWLPGTLQVSSLGLLAILVAHYQTLYDLPQPERWEQIRDSPAFRMALLLFASSLVSPALRIRGIVRSFRTVEQDKRAYDACWAAVARKDAGLGVIQKLHSICDQVAAELEQGPRQRVRAAKDDECSRDSTRRHSLTRRTRDTITSVMMHSVENSVGPLVEDLEQLMVQAAGLDLFLRDKVKEWAVASGGMLQVATEAGKTFMRWDVIVGDVGQLEKVQWAKLKTSKRAVEKLYRSYDCDVSRLLDCCRQSLYFEDLGSLLAAFRAITSDSEVQVMRTNNRLRHDYNSEKSSGYRDLMINLRIDTADTRRLFLDAHICEVQLVLVDFAHIKTEAGHARYVQWRNLRGQ